MHNFTDGRIGCDMYTIYIHLSASMQYICITFVHTHYRCYFLKTHKQNKNKTKNEERNNKYCQAWKVYILNRSAFMQMRSSNKHLQLRNQFVINSKYTCSILRIQTTSHLISLKRGERKFVMHIT